MGTADFFIFPPPMGLQNKLADILDEPADERLFYNEQFMSKLKMQKPWPTEITGGAIRGRTGEDGRIVQCVEPRSPLFTNTITTVEKDNVIIYPIKKGDS